MDTAIQALRDETPDVILMPALVSPAEEAQLLDSLRSLPNGTYIDVLITPALAAPVTADAPASRFWLRSIARWRTEPQAAGKELRYFEERLLWSFERARERQDRDALHERQAVPAVEASSSELALVPYPDTAASSATAPDDRRLYPRFAVEQLLGLRAVRICLGPSISLVDMSAGGALIESDQPLRPGAEARLELADARGVRTVPFRVVRGWVSSLEGARRFRGACMFAEPLDLSGLVLPEPAVQTP
ncbi:MAG TPA: PilZ domain-containing protein [Vicinamibacterales bacterium]|nr:PilZ domain-containing protein [Vicinamibacterales bacterium]